MSISILMKNETISIFLHLDCTQNIIQRAKIFNAKLLSKSTDKRKGVLGVSSSNNDIIYVFQNIYEVAIVSLIKYRRISVVLILNWRWWRNCEKQEYYHGLDMLVRAHKERYLKLCKHSEIWMEHHNLQVVESTWPWRKSFETSNW